MPGLRGALCRENLVLLKQLIVSAGHLTPDLTDSTGPLLMDCDKKKVSLNNMSGKKVYMDCVKIIHRKNLCNREPTVWKERL